MSDKDAHAANKRAAAIGLRSIINGPVGDVAKAVAATYASDATLRAFHPVNELTGVAAIEAELWRPLREALPDAERRDLIVAGGDYQGADYVCLYSHIQGTFANDWLDIPANDSVVTLRCCEINRMADGLIVESHVLIDVLDLMHQAGCWPISPSLGAEGQWQPPASHDGVQLDTADPENGSASLKIVKAMHAGLGAFDGENFDSMHHAQYWTENFMWYGPSGIGTTRGLAGFEAHHQIPFLRAFPDRRVAVHIANVGDGDYVVTGGWPSVVATHSGPDWLNVGPTGRHIEMRVMDFYRVEDDLLIENWVPIDIADILRQMGVDIFARLRHLNGKPRRTL
ncbi:MAG: nuclear transport factor 2 family protein [Woeseiaceae bacterium]|nr:nuclear transport factor 2 family protein [Woeseiaceae bacterium]